MRTCRVVAAGVPEDEVHAEIACMREIQWEMACTGGDTVGDCMHRPWSERLLGAAFPREGQVLVGRPRGNHLRRASKAREKGVEGVREGRRRGFRAAGQSPPADETCATWPHRAPRARPLHSPPPRSCRMLRCSPAASPNAVRRRERERIEDREVEVEILAAAARTRSDRKRA